MASEKVQVGGEISLNSGCPDCAAVVAKGAAFPLCTACVMRLEAGPVTEGLVPRRQAQQEKVVPCENCGAETGGNGHVTRGYAMTLCDHCYSRGSWTVVEDNILRRRAAVDNAIDLTTNEQRAIAAECDAVKQLLLGKNAAYGNSALSPLRIFSKADNIEQLKVRIDDKLSRLGRGSPAGEDVEEDLIGYLIMLRVARKLAKEGK